MIKYIFIKELQSALSNNRLLLSCLILTLLMLVGGFVFEKQYVSLKNEYEESVNENQSKMQDIQDSHLYYLATMKQNIGKAPSNLSFISQNNKALPNGIEVNYFRMSVPQKFDSTNNYFRPFIPLDWANIIIYLFSFVCLCFAYDAFSGERQAGTLKLLLSGSVPRWEILTGKLFSLWVLLLIPIVLGILFNLIYFNLSSSITLSTTDYCKILLFLLFTILILGINILLFFGISLLSPNSTVSSIMCLLVWIVFVFVLPNMSWLTANKISPIPGIEEQNRKEESIVKGLSSPWSYAWENKPPTEDVYKWKDMCDKLEEIHKKVWDEYINLIFQQSDLSIRLSKISPFSTFKWINDRIAGTNYYGYRDFYTQVQNYQNSLRTFVNDKDAADPNSYHLFWNYADQHGGTCKSFISKNPLEINEIPYFKYQPASLKSIFSESMADVFLLLGWFIFLFIGAYFLFYRYDVR